MQNKKFSAIEDYVILPDFVNFQPLIVNAELFVILDSATQHYSFCIKSWYQTNSLISTLCKFKSEILFCAELPKESALKSRRNNLQPKGFVIFVFKTCDVNHGTQFSAKDCLHRKLHH